MSAADVPSLAGHRINGVAQLMDSGWDGVFTYLSQAHAVLCAMDSAGGRTDFSELNEDIQANCVEAVKNLCALAHFHATAQHEADCARRQGASA